MSGKKPKRGQFLTETPIESQARGIIQEEQKRVADIYNPAKREYMKKLGLETEGEAAGISKADLERAYLSSSARPSLATVGNVARAAELAAGGVDALLKGYGKSAAQRAERDIQGLGVLTKDKDTMLKAVTGAGVQSAGAETTAKTAQAATDLAKTKAMQNVFGSAVNQMASNYGQTGSPFTRLDTRINPDTNAAEYRNTGIFGGGEWKVINDPTKSSSSLVKPGTSGISTGIGTRGISKSPFVSF